MLRLFMVKPYKKAFLKMEWDGVTYETHSQDDGFFKFEFTPSQNILPGWHGVKVSLLQTNTIKTINAVGEFFIPYPSQFAFISDIDDTFLISHSSKLRKRLHVLLTKNARSRKPFEGVVNHYSFLASYGATANTYNPFFFVSSSEWNLYDFIVEFARNNKLPKGVYLLNQLKIFSQVWKTGQNNHGGKFMRIARILEAYPNQKFILLGDDSQQDPNIYSKVVQHFPGMIYAVYLRNVRRSSWERVKQITDKIELEGVSCCYFKHSAEAVLHSKKIGLIGKV